MQQEDESRLLLSKRTCSRCRTKRLADPPTPNDALRSLESRANAVVVEMQNTGALAIQSEIVASIEHPLCQQPGDWRISTLLPEAGVFVSFDVRYSETMCSR
jgi:hypothetical protein